MKGTGRFDPRLESLRGVAAFAVVATHTVAIFRVDGSMSFWTLPLTEHTSGMLLLELVTAVFNAGSAVVLFFVLSGYVLTLSLRRSTAGVAAYAVRRGFRLMPPMWASILVMWWMLTAIPHPDMGSYSSWFASVFIQPSKADVLSNMALWSFNANAVTWTMYIEAVGSIFIPLSLWTSERYGYAMLAVLVFLTVFSYPSPSFAYLVCFHAGVMLAIKPPRPVMRPRILVFVGFALFVIDKLMIGPGPWSILTNTFGAALVIVGVMNGAIERYFMHRLTRFIGRVSYSLYLFQLLAIYLTAILVGQLFEPGLLATVVAAAIVLPLSLVTAYACYVLFEAPSIRAGQEMSRWVSLRFGSPRGGAASMQFFRPTEDVRSEEKNRREEDKSVTHKVS